MEKLNYKELSIKDIVKISNERLSDGIAFKDMCQSLSTSDKTLKSYLKDFGYDYCTKEKQVKPIETYITTTEFEKWKIEVEYLKAKIDEITDTVSTKTITEIDNIKEWNTDELKGRTVMFDNDLWNKLNAFCEGNKQYKKQDIINSLVDNFLKDLNS